jgi:mannan endo-1,6-alpha-mannosidase
MWGGLVDYSHYTGDKSYDETIGQAIVSQASSTVDFMMPNQHFDLGNDDQVFWALTAMSAAEYKFSVPAGSPSDIYYQLAKNTFNDMAGRWNTTQCGGGLKWQIFPSNNGYDYKSSIANGGFFQLAARLTRYTNNITYAEWADRVYSWMEGIHYINGSYTVFDGAGDLDQCTEIDTHTWSYNAATMIHGSAVMWNITSSQKWMNRTLGHVAAAKQTFFTPFSNASNVMYENECEKTNNCDTDQFSFKAYLSRWMAKSTLMVSEIKEDVVSLLTTSAEAAAAACAGGSTKRMCGTKWYVDGWDGSQGVGQQLSALETIQSLLVGTVSVAGKL